jgi:hypothetical protein
MFSSTDRCGNRLNDWKTIAIRERTVGVDAGAGDEQVVEPDLAGIDRHEQVDALEQGGLAGTGCADQAHHLVRCHVEIDPAQHALVAERLLDSADPELHVDIACLRRRSRSVYQSA